MTLNRENSPYKVVNSEVHHIGRVTVVKDTFLIDGEQYPYTYVINKDSVCAVSYTHLDVYKRQLKSWAWI